MSIESLVNGLTPDEKLLAMELLWRELTQNAPEYASPAWHEKVIAERLQNPVPGASLELDQAKSELLADRNARRTQG